MNRWNFISGLTVTLLLLLVLSGFCVWVSRGLTSEIGSIINENYDGIRAMRELRTSVTRINTHYLAARDVANVPEARETYRHERAQIEAKVEFMLQRSVLPGEHEKATRLKALVQDYFAGYDEYLALKPRASDRFAQLTVVLAGLTGDMADVSDQLVDLNENAILARRDASLVYGRRVTVVAMGFAIFSLAIYVLTSLRLTRGVFVPLRRLRDSIQQVSDRRFDTLVPFEGGEELRQIATGFNRMAAELHRYIRDTDGRALQANRMNRAILEALPYPVYIVDRDFAVRLTNPRAETLSQALGIPGSLPGEVRRQVDEAASARRGVVGDDIRRAVRLTVPGVKGVEESEADYLPQVFRMPEAFDGADGWAVLLVDVTRLRRMDAAKTKALATLGHEVKTPVTGLRMSLHLLLEEKLGPLNSDQRELLEVGRDDCERLLTVLQSLLELARLESGRTEMQLTAHPPGELLAETLAAHGETARRAGTELRLDAAPDLPPVLAEPVQANRVLSNFLTNACKYGRRGEPILLRGRPRGDGYVRFSVVNSGPPLSEAEQSKVFDPFFRRPGESAEGTGLGLAISREIANVHGGRVGVYCPAGLEQVEFFLDLCMAPEGAAVT